MLLKPLQTATINAIFFKKNIQETKMMIAPALFTHHCLVAQKMIKQKKIQINVSLPNLLCYVVQA